MLGRLKPGQVLVRCDETSGEILRNTQGFCDRVEVGQKGILLGHINPLFTFDGYVDKSATDRRRSCTDVFRHGDRYFNTGDLLQLHDDALGLVRGPRRRHLPLEGRERLHQRGGRGAQRRQGRAREQRLRRARCPAPRAAPAWPASTPTATSTSSEFARYVVSTTARLPAPVLPASAAGNAHHRHLQAPEGRLPRRGLRPDQGQRSPVLPRRRPLRAHRSAHCFSASRPAKSARADPQHGPVPSCAGRGRITRWPVAARPSIATPSAERLGYNPLALLRPDSANRRDAGQAAFRPIDARIETLPRSFCDPARTSQRGRAAGNLASVHGHPGRSHAGVAGCAARRAPSRPAPVRRSHRHGAPT